MDTGRGPGSQGQAGVTGEGAKEMAEGTGGMTWCPSGRYRREGVAKTCSFKVIAWNSETLG